LSLDGLSDTESGVAMVPDKDESRHPERVFWKREAENRIARAIGELSPEHQQVIRRAAIEDRPYDEIAKELNIPIGTVRSRLFRARENLRQQMATMN